MTKAEARRRIWARMAATVENDLCVGDWTVEEAEEDAMVRARSGAALASAKEVEKNIAKNVERLEEASKHVGAVCRRYATKRGAT